jgi:hypothetical protein
MCATSAISDYYRDRTDPVNPWPQPQPPVPFPQPYLPPIQIWDQESKQLLREVLDRLDKLDKRLGDIECHDDSKAELKRQLGLI